MRIRYLVALGVISFLGALLFEAPAALLYAASHPEKNPNVRLYGVYGSVMKGGFASLAINNRPVLTDGRWHLHPAWLALLRLSADLDSGGDAVMHLNVSRAVFGKLRLSDVTATGNVKSLLGLLGQPGLPVEGLADLNMPLIRFDAGVPIEVRGNAEVRNLAWTLARDPLPLGTFSATASTDDKGILVSLESGPGPLELSGTMTLSREHVYDLHVQMRPRGDAPPQLQTLVRSLGPVDPQGWYQVRRSGNLAPPPAPASTAK